MGRPEKLLLCCGGQAEEKMCENTRCYCLLGPPEKIFYSGLGKAWTRFYFNGAKGWGITAFKWMIRKILQVLAVYI
jgi:hypothetical protein